MPSSATPRTFGSADVSAATALLPFRRLARWSYRVRQFLRGFRTAVDPEDARRILALLSEAELQLFLAMRPRDRRHGVETLQRVERLADDRGVAPSHELLVAALLHDVGKGPLRVEDRIAYVLLGAVSPRLVDRLVRAEGARWRVALWRLREHAALGAAQLAAIGSASRVVALTAAHHRDRAPSEDLELAWLLAADAGP